MSYGSLLKESGSFQMASPVSIQNNVSLFGFEPVFAGFKNKKINDEVNYRSKDLEQNINSASCVPVKFVFEPAIQLCDGKTQVNLQNVFHEI